jgi:polar amino acid transport system substrate-binding protein
MFTKSVARRAWLTGSLLVGLAAMAQSALADSSLQRARAEGLLRIGFANEPPWGFIKPDGTLTGEAPEILKILAPKLGVKKIEGVLVEFGSLIPGLQAKRFDVIATALYIRPARCVQVAFTNPTVAIGMGLVVNKGNPLKLHSYEDVAQNGGARLGLVAGTTDLQYAREAGVPEARIVQLGDPTSELEALRGGRIDAISGTGPTVQLLIDRTNGEFERALPFPRTEKTTGYGAFAVRKDDTELLQALNKELASFVGTDEHLGLVKEFGVTKEEIPSVDATAEKICGAK